MWGGAADVGGDRTETLTENNRRHTTWEMADILKIPKSITLLVKMKNVFYFMENYTDFVTIPTDPGRWRTGLGTRRQGRGAQLSTKGSP